MVTVFSKPACVQCTATYKALNRKGIEYNTVDVTQDTEAYERLMGMGVKAMPFVEVEGGDSWSGFKPEKINALA